MMFNLTAISLLVRKFSIYSFGLFWVCNPFAHSAISDNAHNYEWEREAWKASGDPYLLFDSLTSLRWSDLPRQGSLPEMPWAGAYWPNSLRGIAWRWQVSYSEDPIMESISSRPSLKNLEAMSPQQIAMLSPAEKYDIAQGRYDYPLTSAELNRTGPEDPTWWGLCHGWAAASVNFKEPGTVKIINPDGLAVPFYSSDLKALLSFAQQYNRKRADTRLMALRCNETISFWPPGRQLSDECRDANPGAFHLALVEAIAVRQTPLIIDMKQDLEVWNVPLYSFDTRVLYENVPLYLEAAPGTKQIIAVETVVGYTGLSQPQQMPFLEGNHQNLKKILYRYLLELDEKGIIVGGEWVTNGTPDFLWYQTPFQFSGYFQSLESIYASSID